MREYNNNNPEEIAKMRRAERIRTMEEEKIIEDFYKRVSESQKPMHEPIQPKIATRSLHSRISKRYESTISEFSIKVMDALFRQCELHYGFESGKTKITITISEDKLLEFIRSACLTSECSTMELILAKYLFEKNFIIQDSANQFTLSKDGPFIKRAEDSITIDDICIPLADRIGNPYPNPFEIKKTPIGDNPFIYRYEVPKGPEMIVRPEDCPTCISQVDHTWRPELAPQTIAAVRPEHSTTCKAYTNAASLGIESIVEMAKNYTWATDNVTVGNPIGIEKTPISNENTDAENFGDVSFYTLRISEL